MYDNPIHKRTELIPVRLSPLELEEFMHEVTARRGEKAAVARDVLLELVRASRKARQEQEDAQEQSAAEDVANWKQSSTQMRKKTTGNFSFA